MPQYKLPESRFKVDWFSDTLKLCIEFDGYLHYTSSRQIISDKRKDTLCSILGLKMVRIPYFIQLSREVIQNLFKIDIQNYRQTYPHGFISKKSTMVFPSDFCQLGIKKIEKDLEKFSYLKTDIVNSLKEKQLDKYLLLPESLFGLLK